MKNNLNDIVRRVEKLERTIFPAKKGKMPVAKVESGKKKLPNLVLGLRDSNFFKQPKTAPEVHAKLQSMYGCELNRVVMALFRLSERKALRVTSKKVGGKKLKAYVW